MARGPRAGPGGPAARPPDKLSAAAATAKAKAKVSGPGRLTEEDRALWEQVAKTAQPLKAREPPVLPGDEPPEAAAKAASPPKSPPGKTKVPPKAPAKGPAKGPAPARKLTGPSPLLDPGALGSRAPDTPGRAGRKPAAPELSHGVAAGIDRRQAVRLRRGRLPIDGRLDLHGDTQVEAHRKLDAYLARAQASGKRCILVVTGRGLHKAEGGVLKVQVPRWLNLPPNRERVLAFDIAQPKDGGDGALYVLLKRERGD